MEDEVAGGTGYLCSGVSPLPMHGWISKRRGRANGKCVTRLLEGAYDIIKGEEQM